MTIELLPDDVVTQVGNVIRKGHGCPTSKPYALVSKSTGKVLGCHESQESAYKQEAAIKASGHWSLTREEVAALCGSCAAKMESLNITELKLSDEQDLPEDFKQALMTALQAAGEHEPGFFRYCRQRIGPRSKPFCAWLHHKLLGRWPSQDSEQTANEQFAEQAIKTQGSGRSATLHGRPFRVVPAVLVKSQVLKNNLGRSYLPASEITEEWAEMWNGIPVLIGDHPRMHGEDVSGRTPALWEERQVGWIFNAKVEQGDNTARLVAEVWLDETRADIVEGYKAVLEAVQSGSVVELSTGFRTRVEASVGRIGNETYDIIMHPVAPDHLVISTEFTGACSVRDGCGLGAHTREDAPVETKTKTGILSKVVALFEVKPAKLTAEDQRALHIKRLIEADNETDSEKMQALRESLQAEYGSDNIECIISDTITAENKVIFWWSTPMGPFPKGGEYLMSNWTETDGKYSFSEPVPVRKMTSYQPVGNATAKVESADNRGVAAATNCEPDKGKESTMSDQNKDLAAQVASLVTAVQGLTEKVTAMETAAKADPNPAIAGLKQQLAKLTDEFQASRSVTEAAVNERERERRALIRKLAGHVRVPFNEAELEAEPLDRLRKLNDMAEGTNFAARGGPQGSTGSADETRYAEPESPWSKDEKGGK